MNHLFALLLFILPSFLFSYSVNTQEVDTTLLSKDPIWLKLLHFDDEIQEGTIISNDFYLSPRGKKSPKYELEALIDAYHDDRDVNDTSAVCRFPARYLWLSKKMQLSRYKVIHEKCQKLSSWKSLKKTTSISFLLVSGYLGNPASVFGHSFIKLNEEEHRLKSNLFDMSINYGAMVPEGEPSLNYIFKGLTGGYEAGFSDKYYYIQDLVYSNTEFRDIWDYQLNLDEEQKLFLLLHIWEIVGKKFEYVFTTRNCAYEVSKLLEVILKEPIVHSANAWYAPVESCHSLRAIDDKKKKEGKKPLIKKVVYIPSDQRVIYAHYDLLKSDAKKAVSEMIAHSYEKIPSHYSHFSQEDQIEIIDFVLAYYKYLLVKDSDDNATKEEKNKILLTRLKLPAKKPKSIIIPRRVSPDFDNKLSSFGLGMGYNKKEKAYQVMRIAPFSIESIGQNTLDGNELKICDTMIGINGKEENLFIESFDLIKIRNYKTMHMPFDNENPWSWQIHLGMQKLYGIEDRYDIFAKAGIGRSFRLTESTLLFSMLNFSLHHESPNIKLNPQAGLFADMGKLKMIFALGYSESFVDDKSFYNVSIESAYKIADDYDVVLSYEKEDLVKSSLVLRYFFDL